MHFGTARAEVDNSDVVEFRARNCPIAEHFVVGVTKVFPKYEFSQAMSHPVMVRQSHPRCTTIYVSLGYPFSGVEGPLAIIGEAEPVP